MIDPHGDLIQQFLGPDVRIVPAGGITPDERRDLRAEAIRAEQIAAERRKSAFFAAPPQSVNTPASAGPASTSHLIRPSMTTPN